MTISDQMDDIETIKTLIKQAIIRKGVMVTDNDSFASYPEKIAAIYEGPQNMNTLDSSGTIELSDNSVNQINITGAVTFTLPTITDLTVFHQILIQVYMPTAKTINLGTSYYFNGEVPDLSAAGCYNLFYEYDNTTSHWVVGSLSKKAS